MLMIPEAEVFEAKVPRAVVAPYKAPSTQLSIRPLKPSWSIAIGVTDRNVIHFLLFGSHGKVGTARNPSRIEAP